MMIIDSSALVAILFREPLRHVLEAALERAGPKEMSVSNYLEVQIALRRKLPEAGGDALKMLLRELNVALAVVDEEQINAAAAADGRFGKGSGHPAGLNFGDCFAYALAKVRNAPLLFIGNDFIHTDIEPALG